MINEFSKKESPILGLAGMGGGVPSRLLTLASGTTTYVDDVFSTFLYDGTGSALTITNGINLSGEGGLVWTKRRNITRNHILFDSERGTSSRLMSDHTNGAANQPYSITMNSNGYAWSGTDNDVNITGSTYCSWTFRKCPGFFDIVTWTANDQVQQLSHNLGSVPGMIIVKRTDDTGNWLIWHRSLPNSLNDFLRFDTADKQSAVGVWGNNAPTSDYFEFNAQTSGREFIAYVFAHNDGSFGEDSDEAVIKCGSYTGTGAAGNQITLGFEPQWLIVKNTSASNQNWEMFDNMRGVATGGTAVELFPNTSSAERAAFNIFNFNATGFETESTLDETNANGDSYIYIAIRRPHKPPGAGTDVFKPELLTSDSQTFNPGFAPDMNWHMFNRSSSSGFAITGTRLTGNSRYLQTYSTAAEAGSGSNWEYDAPTGKFTQGISTGSTSGGIEYFFKRAPEFFDVVTYSGTGSAQTVNHTLSVAPEMVWVKSRNNTTSSWSVTSSALGSGNYMFLTHAGVSSGSGSNTQYDNNQSPTSTVFYRGSEDSQAGTDYIAFLFASLSGISKIGTFTGTGSDLDIDCGFTAGARFVLIKRTDSTGDWYIWDTARGILSGNDPYLKLNGGQEVTNTDYIDPLNAGFTVTSSAPAAINASGGTYLFFAIA